MSVEPRNGDLEGPSMRGESEAIPGRIVGPAGARPWTARPLGFSALNVLSVGNRIADMPDLGTVRSASLKKAADPSTTVCKSASNAASRAGCARGSAARCRARKIIRRPSPTSCRMRTMTPRTEASRTWIARTC
jgi:hypothetical protein